MKTLKKIALILIFILATASAFSYYVYQQILNTQFFVPNHRDFVVQKGDTAFKLLTDIPFFQAQKNQTIARIWLKLNKEKSKIKLGHFELEEKESLISFFKKLVTGKQKQFSVALIEGQTFDEWLETLQNAEYLQIDQTDETKLYEALVTEESFCANQYQKLEGCLLADTYSYTSQDTLTDVLRRTYIQMSKALSASWRTRFQDIAIQTPYEALIMASIIEKETAVASERGLISGVFNNRLHNRMRLQTDPTVIYGVRDEYEGDITRKHLRTPTPYNTYVIKGLPITPIAMVGLASLEAATKPELTEYLYFVAKGDGTHYFSESLQEHNRAVREYQLNKGN